jgi:ribonuclease D
VNVTTQVLKSDLSEELAERIAEAGYFACDIETSGLDPKRDRIGTVQIYSSAVGSIVVQVSSAAPLQLCRLIEDEGVVKIFHHAMFDLRFMVEHWQIDPSRILCTKIASKLLDRESGHGRHTLQSLIADRLGVFLNKEQRLSNWSATVLTTSQLKYAVADVEYLPALFESLEQDLEAAGLGDLYSKCVAFIPGRVQLELGSWPDVFTY